MVGGKPIKINGFRRCPECCGVAQLLFPAPCKASHEQKPRDRGAFALSATELAILRRIARVMHVGMVSG